VTPNNALFLFYLAHAASYLVIAAALELLHRSYGRPYLRYWAFSWWALCCHRAVGSLLLYPLWGDTAGGAFLALLFTAWLTTAWWHFLWLGAGTYQVTFDKSLRQRTVWAWAGGLAAAALALTLTATPRRDLGPSVLIVLAYLPTATVFLAVGLALFRRFRWRGGLGRVLVTLGFISFGLQRALYLGAGLRDRSDLVEYFAPLIRLAQLEFPIVGVLGVGMVVWLLDEESSVRREAAALESQGIVVAGLAHEVRNPLFAMSASVDTFAVAHDDASSASYIEHLRRQIRTLARQTDRLIEFGRPLDARFAEGDIDDVVRLAIADLAPQAEAIGLRVEREKPSALARVPMDAGRLTVALEMLIENAIEHSPPDGRVVVATAQREDGWLEICVRDQGSGFSDLSRRRALDPFFSEHPNRAGLGLAIARRIIEAHDGRLVLRHPPDGGAVTCLQLPVAGQL